MASIQELKSRIDLHDLAARLGITRGKGGNTNYHSPHHRDKSPSLSIDKAGKSFRDFSAEGVPYSKGSCVDLLMYVKGLPDVGDAMKWLHEEYGIPFDSSPSIQIPVREKSRVEFIADRCLADPSPVRAYLNSRSIYDAVIDAAIKNKTLGFNHWTSAKKEQGQFGYGGEAAAFMVRHPLTSAVLTVDLRYLNPDLNGSVKTQTQGDKDGIVWTSDLRRLKQARQVYSVESAINCLSIETANSNACAIALRGLGNVDLVDWSFLRGKQIILCLDNDLPFPDEHRLAGQSPLPRSGMALSGTSDIIEYWCDTS